MTRTEQIGDANDNVRFNYRFQREGYVVSIGRYEDEMFGRRTEDQLAIPGRFVCG